MQLLSMPMRADGSGRSVSSRARAGAAACWGGLPRCGVVTLITVTALAATASATEAARASDFERPGPQATLAEIEACVSHNLPDAAGVIDFSVEAVDRTGVVTASRAEIRWRKDDAELAQVVLRVSEPAKTAGTALLIVDHASDQPEFFVRLPELQKVKRIRSKRLRGPVLGTDFSYEDLGRLRDPLARDGFDRPQLELIGLSEVEGRPAWLLETLTDDDDGSEYARVLTYVELETCLPIQIDLFEEGDRLRKRLRAPIEEIRTLGDAHLPYVFVMEDLRRETHTVIRIESFDSSDDLPAAQFTKRALENLVPAPAPAASR